jgi:hypothetical protein
MSKFKVQIKFKLQIFLNLAFACLPAGRDFDI